MLFGFSDCSFLTKVAINAAPPVFTVTPAGLLASLTTTEPPLFVAGTSIFP